MGPEPTSSPATVVRLRRLPTQGLVVGRAHGVVFVDLDGRVLDRLGGFDINYQWTVPGSVILRRHEVDYVLEVAAHRLRPLTSADSVSDLTPQFQNGVDPTADRWLDAERPDGAPDASGFWAYTLPSPDGSVLLGQWSGECEVPTAFFLAADGTDPVVILGRPRHPLESRGLGWTEDGHALVHLMDLACGSGGRPGIYLVPPGREPRLLMRIPVAAPSMYSRFPGIGAVRMWGAA
jgi:hypothetical protein